MPPTTRLTLTQLDHLLAGRRQLMDRCAARRLAWPIVSTTALDTWPIETVLAEEFHQLKKVGNNHKKEHRHQHKSSPTPRNCSSRLGEETELQLQHGNNSAAQVEGAAHAVRRELAEKLPRDSDILGHVFHSLDPNTEISKGKRRASLPPIKEEVLRATMGGAAALMKGMDALPVQDLQRDPPSDLERDQIASEQEVQRRRDEGRPRVERRGSNKKRRLLNRSEWPKLKSKSKARYKPPSRLSRSALEGVDPYERIACGVCGRMTCRARMAWHCRNKHPDRTNDAQPAAPEPQSTKAACNSVVGQKQAAEENGVLLDRIGDQLPSSSNGLEDQMGGGDVSPVLSERRFSLRSSSVEEEDYGLLMSDDIQSDKILLLEPYRVGPDDSRQDNPPGAIEVIQDKPSAQAITELEPRRSHPTSPPLLKDSDGSAQNDDGVLLASKQQPPSRRRSEVDPLEKVQCEECQRMIARARLKRHARTHLPQLRPGGEPVGKMVCPFCRAFYTKSRSSLCSHVSRSHREDAHLVRSVLPARISWDTLAVAIEEQESGKSQNKPPPVWLTELLDNLPLQAGDLLLPVTPFTAAHPTTTTGFESLSEKGTDVSVAARYHVEKLEPESAELSSEESDELDELDEVDELDDSLSASSVAV